MYIALSALELKPGMVAAKDVLDLHGRTLLSEGSVLNQLIIDRLAAFGVHSVPIEANMGARGRWQPIIKEQKLVPRTGARLKKETLDDATRTARVIFDQVHQTGSLNAMVAYQVVDGLLEEILSNMGAVSTVSWLKDVDAYTYEHSIGVCVLALTVGGRLAFDRTTLRDIGMAALLHDIGKARIITEILDKPAKLSGSEWALMRRHPEFGADLLKHTQGIRPNIAEIVLQHHERWDGAGYPGGMQGQHIHPYARIVSLAEVFDSLSSPQPYRPAMEAFEAAETLLAQAGTQFDPELAELFVANVFHYGPGTEVELTDGRTAVVMARNPSAPTRPVVQLGDQIIDLSERHSLGVVRLK